MVIENFNRILNNPLIGNLFAAAFWNDANAVGKKAMRRSICLFRYRVNLKGEQ